MNEQLYQNVLVIIHNNNKQDTRPQLSMESNEEGECSPPPYINNGHHPEQVAPLE